MPSSTYLSPDSKEGEAQFVLMHIENCPHGRRRVFSCPHGKRLFSSLVLVDNVFLEMRREAKCLKSDF